MKQCTNGHFFDENRFSVCPYCNPAKPANIAGATPANNRTMPLVPQDNVDNQGKTVGIMKKSIGIDPPVGFLVCISGPQKGEHFRLVSGRNLIGRSPSMNVCLKNDDTVTREEHAVLTFDVKSVSFLLVPGSGRGITYCNDKQVEAPAALVAYDVVEVGSTRLLFLPLCGERFCWNED